MPWVVLIATITAAELQAAMLAALTAANVPISKTKDGLWQNFVQWVALLFRVLYAIVREIGLNSFLPTASGQGLTDLAAGTYGTGRRTETFASGELVLTNTSGVPLDEPAEAISFALVADPSVTYRNSGPVYVVNGGAVVVPIVCDVAGTKGNAAGGSIFTGGVKVDLVTTLVGVAVVSNGAIVGQDKQEDEPLRELASKQAASASSGQGNKYEWYALNTNVDGSIAEPNDGKVRTNINRCKVTFQDAQGYVYVKLASPAGPVDPDEFATTVGVLRQYALTNPGILVAANATAVPLAIVADVVMRNGSQTTGVADQIAAQLATYFPDTSIGGDDGFLTLEELKLEMGRANKRIVEVTVTSPAADLALFEAQVATLASLTLNITVQP